jgi:hypothetical protein
VLTRWSKSVVSRRQVILALLISTAAAIYAWRVFRTRAPAVLTYCMKYAPNTSTETAQKVQPERSFIETKTLKISAAYYGSIIEVADAKASDVQRLDVAYPSMKPWASVPWLKRSTTQKIEVELHGVTLQTVNDIFETHFLGTPKPVHMAPIYGLDQFVRHTWGQWQMLLPLEVAPRVILDCAYSGSLKDETRLKCSATTFTNWNFKVIYQHERILLAEWQNLHAKVTGLIESFVVSP